MQGGLPNPVWLRSFEAAARRLNFTRAAEDLGLTQTAISLHIKSLEETLGAKLFLRNPRNLTLTDMGKAYEHAVRKALADISLATVSLFGSTNRQTVTLRAPTSTAALLISPHLPNFMAAHPGVNVRMITTIWTGAMTNADVDVDLRLGFGEWTGVQAERLSTERMVPVCAAEVADKVLSPADMLRGPLVQILSYEDSWERYFASHGLAMDPAAVRYLVDTTMAAGAIVASGTAYAMIIERFLPVAAKSGIHILPVGDPMSFAQAHYIVETSESRPARPEVELLKAWLRDLFVDPV